MTLSGLLAVDLSMYNYLINKLNEYAHYMVCQLQTTLHKL